MYLVCNVRVICAYIYIDMVNWKVDQIYSQGCNYKNEHQFAWIYYFQTEELRNINELEWFKWRLKAHFFNYAYNWDTVISCDIFMMLYDKQLFSIYRHFYVIVLTISIFIHFHCGFICLHFVDFACHWCVCIFFFFLVICTF